MSTAARRLGFNFVPASKKAKTGGKQPHTRVVEDGIAFASHTERDFYRFLKLWRAAGRIVDIECHPEFAIQEKFVNARGVKRRGRVYTADFNVTLADGSSRVFEVKGAKTKNKVVVGPYIPNPMEFGLRRDAVELRYGIAIWTVYPDGGQWIDADTKRVLEWT